MNQTRILVADNDLPYLDTLKGFLQEKGFDIITAESPASAREILENDSIDLAIIDMRLSNDKDRRDFSGLKVAQISPEIPKIILSRYPSTVAIREALGARLEGLPLAVDFVYKREGLEAILTAIREAISIASRFDKIVLKIEDQITASYSEAHNQALWNNRISLVMAIAGMLAVLAGITLAFRQLVELGVASAVTGLISNATAVLFFRRADEANTRLDRLRRELLETRRFKKLLDACDEVIETGRQSAVKEKVIQIAAERWFSVSKE